MSVPLLVEIVMGLKVTATDLLLALTFLLAGLGYGFAWLSAQTVSRWSWVWSTLSVLSLAGTMPALGALAVSSPTYAEGYGVVWILLMVAVVGAASEITPRMSSPAPVYPVPACSGAGYEETEQEE